MWMFGAFPAGVLDLQVTRHDCSVPCLPLARSKSSLVCFSKKKPPLLTLTFGASWTIPQPKLRVDLAQHLIELGSKPFIEQ